MGKIAVIKEAFIAALAENPIVDHVVASTYAFAIRNENHMPGFLKNMMGLTRPASQMIIEGKASVLETTEKTLHAVKPRIYTEAERMMDTLNSGVQHRR